MNGAKPAGFIDFLFRLEAFAAIAIPALVMALVDVPVIEHLLDKLLAPRMMAWRAGLDEIVEADVEGAPHFLELPGHVVAVFLGVAVQFGGAARDLDGVFIVAHQEMYFKALHAAVAGLHVGADFLEGGADVRPAIGIVDRQVVMKNFLVMMWPDQAPPLSPQRWWGSAPGKTPHQSLRSMVGLDGFFLGGREKLATGSRRRRDEIASPESYINLWASGGREP